MFMIYGGKKQHIPIRKNERYHRRQMILFYEPGFGQAWRNRIWLDRRDMYGSCLSINDHELDIRGSIF